MANGLLTGLLTGGLTQYLADEDASDKLKGNIIDAVSRKLYEVDIPTEEAAIKKNKVVKDALVNQFGKNTADVFDNLGFIEGGNLDNTLTRINEYLEKYNETGDSFRNKIEKFVKDNPKDFSSVYGQTLTGRRATQLEDKREHVNKLFSNTPYIRDLLIAPGQEQKGVMGKLFGGRVTPSGQIAARGRLEEAVQIPTMEMPAAEKTPAEMFGLKETSATASFSSLNASDRNAIIGSARQLYKEQYFDEYSKRYKNPKQYKDEYNKLPPEEKNKISEDDYSFRKYFTERYLPNYYGISSVAAEAQSNVPVVVLQAQEVINRLKTLNPNDPAIEQIKEDLRQQLGVTNLSEYGL
jgi:hypothetical protein